MFAISLLIRFSSSSRTRAPRMSAMNWVSPRMFAAILNAGIYSRFRNRFWCGWVYSMGLKERERITPEREWGRETVDVRIKRWCHIILVWSLQLSLSQIDYFDKDDAYVFQLFECTFIEGYKVNLLMRSLIFLFIYPGKTNIAYALSHLQNKLVEVE